MYTMYSIYLFCPGVEDHEGLAVEGLDQAQEVGRQLGVEAALYNRNFLYRLDRQLLKRQEKDSGMRVLSSAVEPPIF